MAEYVIKTVVEYEYTVEADSEEEAEAQGWEYENYPHAGVVQSIDWEKIDDEEEVSE
jgi:hypothetical protein